MTLTVGMTLTAAGGPVGMTLTAAGGSSA